MIIQRKCVCGKTFKTHDYLVKKGKGIFCCKRCYYDHAHRPSGLKYILHKVNPTSFKKGQKPWNTGLAGKGICKANYKCIKKGEHRGLKTEFKVGNESWNTDKKIWTGSRSEYTKLHRWVRKQKGKPLKCAKCGSTKRMVWANKSQKYKKEIDDWIELCKGCHTKYDFNFIKENLCKQKK